MNTKDIVNYYVIIYSLKYACFCLLESSTTQLSKCITLTCCTLCNIRYIIASYPTVFISVCFFLYCPVNSSSHKLFGGYFLVVSRVVAKSEKRDMNMLLDVNTEIYPLNKNERFLMVLSPSLVLNTKVNLVLYLFMIPFFAVVLDNTNLILYLFTL